MHHPRDEQRQVGLRRRVRVVYLCVHIYIYIYVILYNFIGYRMIQYHVIYTHDNKPLLYDISYNIMFVDLCMVLFFVCCLVTCRCKVSFFFVMSV